jgi:class 3 adenylate cyclase
MTKTSPKFTSWMRPVGLCYLRVSIRYPFRLQFYCNGHGWLARKMTEERIDFATADNAFLRIADFKRAQELADSLKPDTLHQILDVYVKMVCPILDVFEQKYY